jgi:predicted nucleic acid-binding protein
METVLVDTNVLFDYLTEDSEWFDWSATMLGRAADRGAVAINPIVFAELSVRYERIEAIDAAVPRDYFLRLQLPWEAAFVAAKCYDRYRRRGGTRTAPLPDFFIGAHAAVSGLTLLTRDARRYRAYFPKLKIVAP